ncbi:MAG: type I restriction endonuclease [Cyanobacteria bacterium P01_E01_bin.42]
MAKTISASDLTLHEVKTKFNLRQVDDESFFSEWQEALLEIKPEEKEWCDRIKADFLSLEEYEFHEEIVKLAVLAPILSLAGFFRHPFHANAEVQITDEDEGQTVRGKIDVLLLKQQFWIAVIEAKNKQFSLIKALSQTLFYMMGTPFPEKPTFGLLTNGSHFMFVKVIQGKESQYALSDEFSLYRRGNELYSVIKILRRLGEL